MSDELSRLMQTLLHPATEVWRQMQWSPPVDVYRTRDGWLVKLDLAGVRSSDIELTVSGDRLCVRGRRRDWVVEEGGPCSAYSMEITYSHFERTVALPCDLEQMQIEHDYRDGMLLVRFHERTSGAGSH